MPTIGQKLEETRLGLGLTVEDVAHVTRIHPSMILSIEEDDFSRFPSVAYAKSFIRKYGDCLGVDLAETMETLGGGIALSGDKEWMAEAKRSVRKARRFHWGRFGRSSAQRSGKSGVPLFLNFILVALMGALGIFYFLGYNAPTPEKAREEIVRGLGLPLPFAEAPAPEAERVEANPLKPDADAPPASPERPAIELPRDEVPAVAAHPPRPRPTPAIGDDIPATPLPLEEDLPAVSKLAPEPQAASLPETADPAATTKREPETAPLPAEHGAPPASGAPPGPPRAPQPILRAVPVAVSE